MKVSIRLWTAYMVILKLIRRQKVPILPLKTYAIYPSIIQRFAIKDHSAFTKYNHERGAFQIESKLNAKHTHIKHIRNRNRLWVE